MNKQIAELIAKMLDEYFDQIIPRLRAENEKAVGEVQKSILLANERLALVKEGAVARDSVEDLIGRRFEDIKSVFESELKASILEIPPGARGKKGEPGRDAHFAPPVAYVSGKDYPYGTVAMYKSGLWFAQRATGQAPDDENSGWSVITQGVDDVDFVWDKDSGLRNFRLYITRSDGEHHSFEVKLPLADYKGVWKEGSFEQFDTVSHQGSAWICLADTDTKPGTDEGKDYWRLQVKSGKDGKAGGRGVSVVEIEKTASYDLIIKTSDGKKHNVGNVRGEKGEKGEKGDSVKGNKGDPGQRGQRGARGATFKDVAFDHEKELVIFHYKDGSSSTTSFQHFELAIRQAISPTSEFNKKTGEVTVKTKSGMTLLDIPFGEVVRALNKSIQWTGPMVQNKSYVPGDLVSVGSSKVIICLKATDKLPDVTSVTGVENSPYWDVFVWISVTPGGGGGGGSGSDVNIVGDATVDEVNGFDPAKIPNNSGWVMLDDGTVTTGSKPVDVVAGDLIVWGLSGYFVNLGQFTAIPGPDGPQGEPGEKGDPGDAATVDAGTTTTIDPGDAAFVSNVGTTSEAIFDFYIPAGEKGDKGEQGEPGEETVPTTFTGAGTTGYVKDPVVSTEATYLRDDGEFAMPPVSPIGGIWLSYDFDADETISPPDAGTVRANHLDQTLATELYISSETEPGNDADFLWGSVQEGEYLGIWETKGDRESDYFQVTGAPVNNGGSWTIPVIFVSGTGGIDNNQQVDVFFIADPAEKVPIGGDANMALVKSTSANYDTEWANLYESGSALPDPAGYPEGFLFMVTD